MLNYILDNDYSIKSERLTFSCFKEADCDDMFAIQSNPEMVKYTPDEPWKSMDDWNKFFNFASYFYGEKKSRPDWFRYFFAIREKNNNRVIGYCGLGAPEYDRSVTEVFYSITPDKWGMGYATESANSMLKFGFEELKLNEIVGFREDGNPASGRVLEKAGLKLVGKLTNLEPEFSYFEGEPLYKITINEYIQ